MGIEISPRLNQCVIAISSAGGRQEALFSKPAAEKAMTTNLSVFARLALWLLKLYQSRMSLIWNIAVYIILHALSMHN